MSKEIGQRIRNLQKIINDLQIKSSDETDELTEHFGLMKFDDDPIDKNTHLAFYLRLATNTQDEKISQFIRNGWNLSTPNLIISIHANPNIRFSPKLKKIFQQDFIQSAVTTNVWIITDGQNEGVAKEVGHAIENCRYTFERQTFDIPIIGLTSWNQIENQLLISHRNQSRHSINAIQIEVFDQYFVRSYLANDLECHHTHFLLFDSQSSHIDNSLRFISKCNEFIPFILILIQPDSSSFQTICQSLQQSIPIILIQDNQEKKNNLFIDLYRYFVNNKPNDVQFNDLLKGNEWFEQSKDEFCELLSKRIDFISIFDLNSNETFEDLILQTLFKSIKYSNDLTEQQQQYLSQIKLAINWNKLDYAKSNLFNEQNLFKFKENDLIDCLLTCLINENLEFVDYFLTNEISTHHITVDQLNHLYLSTIQDSIIPMMKKRKKNKFFNIRDEFYLNYFQDKYSLVGELICLSTDQFTLKQSALNRLFLWSISVHRFRLAKYLSSKIWNPVVGCLLAAKLYRLASDSTTDSDKQKQYIECYSYFDKRSADIIDQCFEINEDLSLDILQSPAKSFDNIDGLQVAADADTRLFISSKSVQTYLDQTWYKHISYKKRLIQFKILLVTLVVPLIPIFAMFLPFIQKHKQIVKKNRKNWTNPIRIDNIEKHDDTQRMKCLEKLICFYECPIVRFYYYGIFFISFLLLYSYVILVDYYPIKQPISLFNFGINRMEMILHLWLLTYLIEEIRQFILLKSTDDYFEEVWNKIDLLGFILYGIALLTRFTLNENIYFLSKSCICLSLIIWYIRVLHCFAAYESLGPKLVMIYGMTKDLLFFICFIFIFLLSFSITCLSLTRKSKEVKWIYDEYEHLVNVTIYPSTFTFQLIQDILNFGIWKVFAQVDPIEGNDLFAEVVYILTILFVALANILLLNVLIALFNITIQNVENRSYTLWCYQKLLLVREFGLKCPIPPPFNIFYYVYSLIQFLFRSIRQSCRKRFRTNNFPVESENLLTNPNVTSMKMKKSNLFKITDLMKRESAISDYLYKKEFIANNNN